MSGGATANSSGKILEGVCRYVLDRYGVVACKPIPSGMRGYGDSKIVPDIKTEPLAGFPDGVFIECRRQVSPGSTKDKNYKTLANIKRHYSLPTWLVVDGKYMDPIYREFNDSKGGNFLGCMTLSEFIEWVEQISGGKCKAPAVHDTRQKKFFAVEI